MSTKFKQLLSELNEQLNFLDLEIDDKIDLGEKAIEIITKSIDNLKKVLHK